VRTGDAAELLIEVTERGTVIVVQVRGELDYATVGKFTEAVGAISESSRVVLDVSRLTFIDSRGLNAVVQRARRVQAAGGHLVVAEPSIHVASVMQIVHFHDEVEVLPSVEDAVARWAAAVEGSTS